jgi:hypothetical protein
MWSAVNSVKNLSISSLGGKLLRSEEGQALGEYAAMLGLTLAILYIVRILGQDSNSVFQRVADAFHSSADVR